MYIQCISAESAIVSLIVSFLCRSAMTPAALCNRASCYCMQAVIHCEIVRQAARVVAMDRERLRSGDRACVRFRFLQRPEYLTAGTRFVFREGRTKGIGMVIGTE